MKDSKFKIISLIVLAIMLILIMPISVYAANEEAVIVKDTNKNEYIIYVKGYLSDAFEFAFANSNAEGTEQTLTFIDSALDSNDSKSSNVAYVDETTLGIAENATYMWIKQNGEYKTVAIDIKDNVEKTELESLGKTSKTIPITLEKKVVEDTTSEQGLRKTTTVGIAKIVDSNLNLQYQLIKRPATGNDNDLFALAELIEKNEFTDSYTKIKASKEFIELYNQQYSNLDNQGWKTVENNEVLQPEETITGDQYILWLKTADSKDVHFLTSYREVDEEWVREEIKTVLPHTYDDNTMLIALVIVVVAIIIVSIRIKSLKKKLGK